MNPGLISVKCLFFQVALGVHPCQAFTVETAITFQLVVCVLATSRPKSAFHLLGPVVVGLSVILGRCQILFMLVLMLSDHNRVYMGNLMDFAN